MTYTTVEVSLGDRSYPIQIGHRRWDALGDFLRARGSVAQAVVISDEAVSSHYAEPVLQALAGSAIDSTLALVPAGEQSKSASELERLWQAVLAAGGNRQTWIVALGGGVVGDLAGFVAASFTRGLRWIQIPTTLLAQVDSSVGGKTGINLPSAKNMVGAFWQPQGVWIDTQVLETLPDREYRAGLAEVVKYGVILDADFFAFLEEQIEALNARAPDVLQTTIARCCRLKADVVEQDEREESGLRAVLNYGHTFCHALVAATGYGQLLHGEGVAIGMLCASRLAERLGRVPPEVTQRQLELLASLGLPTRLPDVRGEELLRLMQHDKKVAQGRIRFVLPDAIGHVDLLDDVPQEDVLAAMDAGR